MPNSVASLLYLDAFDGGTIRYPEALGSSFIAHKIDRALASAFAVVFAFL
jgi:hypothetical protein